MTLKRQVMCPNPKLEDSVRVLGQLSEVTPSWCRPFANVLFLCIVSFIWTWQQSWLQESLPNFKKMIPKLRDGICRTVPPNLKFFGHSFAHRHIASKHECHMEYLSK